MKKLSKEIFNCPKCGNENITTWTNPNFSNILFWSCSKCGSDGEKEKYINDFKESSRKIFIGIDVNWYDQEVELVGLFQTKKEAEEKTNTRTFELNPPLWLIKLILKEFK